MDNTLAANTLGTLGAVCWSIQVRSPSLQSPPSSSLLTSPPCQLIPQIILNYARHHTIGLQKSMMMLWACAGVPLGAYNIASGFNIALLVQPQILTGLSLVTWGQCWYYGEVSLFLFHLILNEREREDGDGSWGSGVGGMMGR